MEFYCWVDAAVATKAELRLRDTLIRSMHDQRGPDSPSIPSIQPSIQQQPHPNAAAMMEVTPEIRRRNRLVALACVAFAFSVYSYSIRQLKNVRVCVRATSSKVSGSPK